MLYLLFFLLWAFMVLIHWLLCIISSRSSLSWPYPFAAIRLFRYAVTPAQDMFLLDGSTQRMFQAFISGSKLSLCFLLMGQPTSNYTDSLQVWWSTPSLRHKHLHRTAGYQEWAAPTTAHAPPDVLVHWPCNLPAYQFRHQLATAFISNPPCPASWQSIKSFKCATHRQLFTAPAFHLGYDSNIQLNRYWFIRSLPPSRLPFQC